LPGKVGASLNPTVAAIQGSPQSRVSSGSWRVSGK
jgi:hypothetical protein